MSESWPIDSGIVSMPKYDRSNAVAFVLNACWIRLSASANEADGMVSSSSEFSLAISKVDDVKAHSIATPILVAPKH